MTDGPLGIFRAAEGSIPEDDYVFVADSLYRDVRLAVKYGWHGIFIGHEKPGAVVGVQRLADVVDSWNAEDGPRIDWWRVHLSILLTLPWGKRRVSPITPDRNNRRNGWIRALAD